MARKTLGTARHWGPGGLSLTPLDKTVFREDIDWFLPKKIFDMHVHVQPAVPGQIGKVSLSLLQNLQKMIFPHRQCNDLILPFPFEGVSADQANKFAFSELRKFGQKDDATLLFAEPTTPAQIVREQLIEHEALGLKVYLTCAQVKDKTKAPLRSFLTEKHMKVLDELGLMVMIHLSKPRAISDPANIRDVETLSQRYPNAKLVLAHCGRCFRPGLFEKVADRLNALPNVYVGTSAVCDPLVFMEVFKNFDLSRVLFGSDHLMAGAVRGRYTEVGTFWVFVGKPDFDWGHLLYHQEPTYVIYEQLRAMGRAAKLLGLSKKQIRDIFWNNAIGLLKELRRAKKRAV